MVLLLLGSIQSAAQLSPGKLTNAHQELEGMSNCTQCHDLGNKVPDNKCLSCHDEISNLLDQNRGYHSYYEVTEKSCVECHNEHHGRNFEIVRFDESQFDHDLTGYILEGQHNIIDCRACHQSENINNPKLKERPNSFLGLEHDCISCHDDYHQNTLGNDCKSCHDFNQFSPASYFDHNEATFQLRGKHTNVYCLECHPITQKNGTDLQQFTDIAFKNCIDCHNTPHKDNWKTDCNTCHSVSGFENFSGANKFNHSVTDFNLLGQHAQLNCFECHDINLQAQDILTDLGGIPQKNCIACHMDVHNGKFGTNCAECHNENSFRQIAKLDKFDHSLTHFALEGLHNTVDCKSCHTNQLTDPLPHNACYDCHNDYHRGEFKDQQNIVRDCNECHSVYEGFEYSSFGIDEHQSTTFPLEGAHLASPCFECHLSEDRWHFRNIGSECIDCHTDIHDGYITESFYPNKDCTQCHNSEIWSDLSFDHSTTSFMLEGAHQNINCANCHIVYDDFENIIKQEFTGLSNDCNNCHDNPHGAQFEVDGITNCKECHTEQDWFPYLFNHNDTEFPLEGQHIEIDCKACHLEKPDLDGIYRIEFKIEKFECIDCHM